VLGDAVCWALAIVLLFSSSEGSISDMVRWVLALGFIFVGTISRFVSVYRDVHSKK
jgi:hypothetical protein